MHIKHWRPVGDEAGLLTDDHGLPRLYGEQLKIFKQGRDLLHAGFLLNHCGT